MAAVDYSANDIFLEDADFVCANAARRDELVRTVRSFVGRSNRKRVPYEQLEKLFDDFEVGYSGDELTDAKDILDYLLREVRRGMDWPIPSLLAWLCCYHCEDGAIPYYEKSQLKEKFKVPYRTYVGEPGDRAKARRGIPIKPEKHVEKSSIDLVEATFRLRLSPPPRSSHSLHYSNAAHRVVGRNEEQEALARFVAGDSRFRWLQLAGVAGQGKSRLAYELILSLGEGWAKGFLRKSDLLNFRDKWDEWKPNKPHLIVIDYVIESEILIGDAMRALARNADHFAAPVRVLLVERHRWDKGSSLLDAEFTRSTDRSEWFAKLNGAPGDDDLAHPDFRFESGIIELKPLESDHLVGIVRDAFASQGRSVIESDASIASYLRKIDKSGRPLYAYLVGQALRDRAFNPEWDKSDLLSFIIDRDQNSRWKAIFGTVRPLLIDNNIALRLAVLGTVIRQVDCSELESVEGWGSLDGTTRRQATALCDFPIGGGVFETARVICGLEPDLLGEFFALSLMENDGLRDAVIQAAWTLSPTETAAFLVRIAQDFPHKIVSKKLLAYVPPDVHARSSYRGVIPTIADYLFNARAAVTNEFLEELIDVANSGNAVAANNLGVRYFTGIGVAKDHAKAFMWYKIGAEGGNAVSMCNLGYSFRNGFGTEPNMEQALYWYRLAAEAGNSGAMSNIGFCYQHGYGVEVDLILSAEWYGKAANAGNPIAIKNYGNCYEHGTGVEKNFARAFELYLQSAQLGCSDAMDHVGQLYQRGDGVEKNLEVSSDWFNRAAEAGSTSGMANAGNAYCLALGVEQSFIAAAKWYSRAVEARHVPAMASLGICYQFALGVEQDFARAVALFEEGVRSEDGKAMICLGLCYQHGEGVPRDVEKARAWFERGAALVGAEVRAQLEEFRAVLELEERLSDKE